MLPSDAGDDVPEAGDVGYAEFCACRVVEKEIANRIHMAQPNARRRERCVHHAVVMAESAGSGHPAPPSISAVFRFFSVIFLRPRRFLHWFL